MQMQMQMHAHRATCAYMWTWSWTHEHAHAPSRTDVKPYGGLGEDPRATAVGGRQTGAVRASPDTGLMHSRHVSFD
eukprot:6367229-Prymnesium_polylepis.1